MRNKGRALLALGLMLACVLGAGRSLAYTGRVIDGSTGKPAVGVYVIGRWETGGGIVVPSSGCIVAVTQSDEKGEFTLRGGDGLLGTLFGPSTRPAIFFYRRGYARTSTAVQKEDTFVVMPDPSATKARLAAILDLESKSQCGSVEWQREKLIPLYRAIYEEAKDIAKEKDELGFLDSAMANIEVLELGYGVAVERSRERRRNWGLQ